MKNQFRQLASDTLAYIKQEGHLATQKKIVITNHLPPKVTLFETKQPVVVEPKPYTCLAPAPAPAPKKENTPIFDLIKKHLPHVPLIEKIPKAQQVAIVVFNNADLPFLKTLAQAIQDRFCLVTMIDGKLIDRVKNWESFTLILSQKELDVPVDIVVDILLENCGVYGTDQEKKRLLWTKICAHLSQKSF